MGSFDEKERVEALSRRCRVADQLARAAAANPGNPVLHLRHGEARRRLGQRKEAARAFRAAARLFGAADKRNDARAALNLALGQLPSSELLQAELAALEREDAGPDDEAMVVQPVAEDVEDAPPIVVGQLLDDAPVLDKAPVDFDLMPEDVFDRLYVDRQARRSLGTAPVVDLGEPS